MTFWKMLSLINNGCYCKKVEWEDGHYIAKNNKDTISEYIVDPYTANIKERPFKLSNTDFEYNEWIVSRTPKKGRMLSDIIFDNKLNKKLWIREKYYKRRKAECVRFENSEYGIRPVYDIIEAPNCFVSVKVTDLTQNSLLASDWIEYIPGMNKELFDIIDYTLDDIDTCFINLKKIFN